MKEEMHHNLIVQNILTTFFFIFDQISTKWVYSTISETHHASLN